MTESIEAAAKCELCENLRRAPVARADCGALLKHIERATYFELFGLEPSYHLAPDDVSRRFLAICRNIHPDRFPVGDAEMQRFALGASAAVNKAYNILKDDFARAEYLLESAGGKSASADKTVAPGLLGQVLILREEIEGAKASEDTAALKSIRDDVASRRDASAARVAELCDQLRDGSDEALNNLRVELNSLKYMNNLLSQLNP